MPTFAACPVTSPADAAACLAGNTWPSFVQAVIGLIGAIAGYVIFVDNKGNLEDVEERDEDIADELFQHDQTVKEYEQTLYDKANSFPDYEECPVPQARMRAEVLRLASRQLHKSINQAGRGQVGLRKSFVRHVNMAINDELGGRWGQAKKHEMLLRQAYAVQKLKPIVESTITGAYPTVLPRSFEATGNAYAAVATFGAKMFNGAYASLNYEIGDIIAQRSLVRDAESERDNLKQEQILTWSPERETPADFPILSTLPEPGATDEFIADFELTEEEQ